MSGFWGDGLVGFGSPIVDVVGPGGGDAAAVSPAGLVAGGEPGEVLVVLGGDAAYSSLGRVVAGRDCRARVWDESGKQIGQPFPLAARA